MTTPKEIVEFAKQNDVEMVDLKFIDFLGTWQHFTVPVSELNEEMLDEGRMFDGSSIRCWQTIDNRHESYARFGYCKNGSIF